MDKIGNHPPVLFVDFDGVLHAFGEEALDQNFKLLPNPHLFCWRHFLEDALEAYPDVRIVVSSDWRRLFDDTNLARLLGSLAPRFLGVVESCDRSRANEIRAEVARRGITEWLAIDDHPSIIEASRFDKRFIACESALGISSTSVRAELAQKLRLLSKL